MVGVVSDRDYPLIAAQYCEGVLSGEIAACEYVWQACDRQVKDLQKADLGQFDWRWNPELIDIEGISYYPAERICKFIELLPHIKGEWAGRPIILEPWQQRFRGSGLPLPG